MEPVCEKTLTAKHSSSSTMSVARDCSHKISTKRFLQIKLPSLPANSQYVISFLLGSACWRTGTMRFWYLTQPLYFLPGEITRKHPTNLSWMPSKHRTPTTDRQLFLSLSHVPSRHSAGTMHNHPVQIHCIQKAIGFITGFPTVITK